MKNNQPQTEVKYDYSSLYLAAILLLGVSQAVENVQTPLGDFLRGVMVGMSIVCSVIGLVLYVRTTRKG